MSDIFVVIPLLVGIGVTNYTFYRWGYWNGGREAMLKAAEDTNV